MKNGGVWRHLAGSLLRTRQIYLCGAVRKITHHDAVINNDEPWEDHPAYNTRETRYYIVDTNTGEVLDDAQGYGYKTAQKAYAAYSYKTRDKSKDNERLAKKERIKNWMKHHKSFVNLMDGYAFEMAKGTMAPDDKFDAKFVKKLLKSEGLEPDFPASELLKVWRNYK